MKSAFVRLLPTTLLLLLAPVVCTVFAADAQPPAPQAAQLPATSAWEAGASENPLQAEITSEHATALPSAAVGISSPEPTAPPPGEVEASPSVGQGDEEDTPPGPRTAQSTANTTNDTAARPAGANNASPLSTPAADGENPSSPLPGATQPAAPDSKDKKSPTPRATTPTDSDPAATPGPEIPSSTDSEAPLAARGERAAEESADDHSATAPAAATERRAETPPATVIPAQDTAPAAIAPRNKSGGRILRFDYGPTRSGETLGSIARSIYIADDIDHFQLMWAIFVNNPDAFILDNINQLRSGVILNVPAREQIQETSPAQAKKHIVSRHRLWQRQSDAALAARIEAAREKARRLSEENQKLNQRLSETEARLQRLLKENEIINQELENFYDKARQ